MFSLSTAIRGRALPVPAAPAGYARLIEILDLAVPLPRKVMAVSPKNQRLKEEKVTIHTFTAWPGDDIYSHLVFALKHEGINLLILKRAFSKIDERELCRGIKATRTGQYARRIWFLYEFLQEKKLPLPDADSMPAVNLLDHALHIAVEQGDVSARHRVRNNLPGTAAFCPIVYRTPKISSLLAKNLGYQSRLLTDPIPLELLPQAAACMSLSEAKASFAIEGTTSNHVRLRNWAKVIGEAGGDSLDAERLIASQKILIPDRRLVKTGLRLEDGFIGVHAADGAPQPEHIGARPQDLESLMQGLVEFAERGRYHGLDPVVDAACQAFGFAHIRPFEDCNGRVHRFIMAHVLAARGFTPPGVVFPVSAVIADRIKDYQRTLRTVSASVLPWIETVSTEENTLRVTNDTIDYYRFYDATSHAEFLLECVDQVIEAQVQQELDFLERRNDFHRSIGEVVDLPERTIDLLSVFLRQNKGVLSKRARTGDFAPLTDDEVREVQSIYADFLAG